MIGAIFQPPPHEQLTFTPLTTQRTRKKKAKAPEQIQINHQHKRKHYNGMPESPRLHRRPRRPRSRRYVTVHASIRFVLLPVKLTAARRSPPTKKDTAPTDSDHGTKPANKTPPPSTSLPKTPAMDAATVSLPIVPCE